MTQEIKKKVDEPKPVEAAVEDNDLKKKQEYFQNCPESYNGAIRDKYSWSQSIKDIDVKVKVSLNKFDFFKL